MNKVEDAKLGKGGTLSRGSLIHPKVVGRLVQVAESARIKLPHEATGRFTDIDTDFISMFKVASLSRWYHRCYVECTRF